MSADTVSMKWLPLALIFLLVACSSGVKATYKADVIVDAVKAHRSSDIQLREAASRGYAVFRGTRYSGNTNETVSLEEAFLGRCYSRGVELKQFAAVPDGASLPSSVARPTWAAVYDGSGHWTVKAACPFDSERDSRWTVAEDGLRITALK